MLRVLEALLLAAEHAGWCVSAHEEMQKKANVRKVCVGLKAPTGEPQPYPAMSEPLVRTAV